MRPPLCLESLVALMAAKHWVGDLFIKIQPCKSLGPLFKSNNPFINSVVVSAWVNFLVLRYNGDIGSCVTSTILVLRSMGILAICKFHSVHLDLDRGGVKLLESLTLIKKNS